jgi:hypothetical protein
MGIASLAVFALAAGHAAANGQQPGGEAEHVDHAKGVPGAEGLGPEARALLAKHGFVVSSETANSVFLFYKPLLLLSQAERDAYFKALESAQEQQDVATSLEIVESAKARAREAALPPFITTDAMLHAYHRVYVDSLKALEERQARHLAKWLSEVYSQTKGLATDTDLLTAEEGKRLIGIVAVARSVMDDRWKGEAASLPTWTSQELRRLREGGGRRYCPAWDRQVEYSSFRPRGFYTKSDLLRRYFIARMWLSRYPLRAESDVERRIAAVLAELAPGTCHEDLMDAPRALLGQAEDPDLSDLRRAMEQVCERKLTTGESIRPDLPRVFDVLAAAFKPRIRVGDAEGELSEPRRLFGVYILSNTYVVGSEVLTVVTRPPVLCMRLPTGLDVMAALGSDLAARLAVSETEVRMRGLLEEALKEARTIVQKDDRSSEVTHLTLRAVQALLDPPRTEAHPPFVRTDAYLSKSTQTALAGWVEHRNRWVLHAKQSSSLFGELPLEAPPGFVEPNVEFWKCLLDLTILTQKQLSKLGVKRDGRWDDLMWALVRCREISERQLKGEELSGRQRGFFSSFDKTLERLCAQEAGSRLPESVVVDVHREVLKRKVVHCGTGPFQAIYVVYPWRGKSWLCKGGVMTYREHVTDSGEVLTDEQWAKLLPRLRQPSWVDCFSVPAKTAPVEAK